MRLGIVLRIETTTSDVSSFKHYRKVEHRNGPSSMGFALMKKTVYSLGDLAAILCCLQPALSRPSFDAR